MEKSIFEQIGGTYHQEGDYFLPNLAAPESTPVGIWGQRHLQYLKKHRQAFYTALLLSGKLNRYLVKIDQQSQDMFFQLVAQMATQEGVTEQLKANCQMEWVGHMNNIQDRVAEIVNAEIIYA